MSWSQVAWGSVGSHRKAHEPADYAHPEQVFGSGQSDWYLIANKAGVTRLGLRCREPSKHGADRTAPADSNAG